MLKTDQEHTSTFDMEWLRRYDYTKKFKPLIDPILWDNKAYQDLGKPVEYRHFLTESGFKDVLGQIRDYGLCFIRDVPTAQSKQVEQVAKKFGTIRVIMTDEDTFYGSTFNVKSDPNSKNIAYTNLFLSLHMDLLYGTKINKLF